MPLFGKRWSRLASMAVLATAALLLASCAMETAPQTMFVPQGSGSDEILKLFRPVFWVAVGVFVLVEGLLIYSVIRYRRKPQDGIPLQIHGNTPIEIAWTVIPAIIVVGIAVLTFRTQAILAQEDPNALVVRVTGHQWWWEFEYPEFGVITANELHIPANRQVRFELTSDDVIHSFWFPRLAGKTDAIPGHVNVMNFTAYQASEDQIRGECAEYCGGTHAMMGMWAEVDPPDEFAQWIEQQQQLANVPEGIDQPEAPGGPAGLAATVEAEVQATNQAQAPGATAVEPEVEAEVAATANATAAASEPPSTAIAQPTSLEAQGYQLFQSKQCIACHAISGYPGALSRLGPDLSHIGSRRTIVSGWLENTPANMRRWLRNPDEVKPGNVMASVITRGYLTDAEIEALSAYLYSLD
jgi:cytochrome c oxidase subunit II